MTLAEPDAGWGGKVAAQLHLTEEGLPTLAQVAQALHVTERTLGRHLQREGIGFRALAAQVRSARCRQLLADGRLSVTAVGMELGYSDAANFSRWFRRAFGLSPQAFRSAQGVAA